MTTRSTNNNADKNLGPITFWGWATQHNLATTSGNDDDGDGVDDGATPPLSVRDQILAILRDYNWFDIADIMAVSRFWPASRPEQTCTTEDALGLVSCTNHPGYANEPKLRFSHAGMRTDKVRKIYILDDDTPLQGGSQSWSLRSGCGAKNEEDLIYRYLQLGVETGPGGPCKTAARLRQLANAACNSSNEGYTRLEINHSEEDEYPGHWLVYLADQKLLDDEFDDETKTIIDEGFIPAAQVFWVPDPKDCSGESDCACLMCYPYRD
jgi:hypothetical protein